MEDMDMTATRATFCEMVGLDDDAAQRLHPSAGIRALWLRAADTYDTEALKPLWRYQAHTLKRHIESIGRPSHVQYAMVNCLIEYWALHRAAGHHVPEPPHAAIATRLASVTEPSWRRVQDAVEHLAQTWEEIGK